MKKYRFFLYLLDNKIIFYEENGPIFIETFPKKIISEGKIIHRPKFVKFFHLFIKKHHFLKPFCNHMLYIIIPSCFEEVDKEILKNTFDDLKFTECHLIKETNLIPIKRNELWIHWNDNYLQMFFMDRKQNLECETLKEGFLRTSLDDQVIQFLKKDNKIRKVFIYGQNKKIPSNCSQIIKKTNKNCYYFEDFDNYLLKLIKKHKLT